MLDQQAEIDLCLSCGLCCNGILFDKVKIYADENKADFSFVTIQEIEDERVYDLPCPAWSAEQGCTQYLNRPKTCRLFRCKLLKLHEKKALSFNEALTKITLAKELIETTHIEIDKKVSFLKPYPLQKKLRYLFPEWGSKDINYRDYLTQDNAKLLLAFIPLNLALKTYFSDSYFNKK